MDSAALRTIRGDKSRLACGPERVVKRAQPLAVGSAVSSPTSDKQFDYSLVIGQAKRALCRISPQQYVDIAIYWADRLAVVCALDRHVFQYRQASSLTILIVLVAQSANSLQAGRPGNLYQINSPPPPLLAEHSGEWPGESPKLDGAILGSAEGEQGLQLV